MCQQVGAHTSPVFSDFTFLCLGTVQEKYITDSQLNEIIGQIPGDQMSRFVTECLKIPVPTYTQIVKSELGSVYDTLMQCMLIWRNKLECWGQDAAENLQIIQQIREKYSQSIPPAMVSGTSDQITAKSTYINNLPNELFTHLAKLGEITGKTRVLYSELGEITGKTQVLPCG